MASHNMAGLLRELGPRPAWVWFSIEAESDAQIIETAIPAASEELARSAFVRIHPSCRIVRIVELAPRQPERRQ